MSVVLPVYNVRPFIEQSIRSLLGQSFSDFELVIGDDGSTDGTTEILGRLAQADGRIRLLRREEPSGLAASANWVIGQTRASIIAVAHADDISLPVRLERQFDVLARHPQIDLVGSLWEGIDEAGRRVRPADWWRLLRISPFAPFSHSSVMFRRSAFNRAAGYRREAEYWEDLDLYARMAAGGSIAVVPEVLSLVRHASTSTRLRDDQSAVEESVDLMFRATREMAAGRLPDLEALRSTPSGSRGLLPMTFVSCGSTRLWSGLPPRTLARCLERGSFRPNPSLAHALLWLVWGTASPRSLRAVLSTILVLRNFVARPILSKREFVSWNPFGRRGRAARKRSPMPGEVMTGG